MYLLTLVIINYSVGRCISIACKLRFFQFLPILFFRKEFVKVTPHNIIRDPVRQLVVAHVTPSSTIFGLPVDDARASQRNCAIASFRRGAK